MAKKRTRRRKRKTYNGSVVESIKGGIFTTRSSYETKYAKILDNNPLVIRFEYESIKVRYKYKNRNCNYVPDFVVTFTDLSQEVHEVKPKTMLKKARNRAKFAAARRNPIPFVLITEDDLFK